MPARADLALGAGHLSAVEVDVEVVPVEAFVPAVLAGGVARQWAAGRGASGTPFTVQWLAPNTTHQFRVAADDDLFNQSEYSNTVTVTTDR